MRSVNGLCTVRNDCQTSGNQVGSSANVRNFAQSGWSIRDGFPPLMMKPPLNKRWRRRLRQPFENLIFQLWLFIGPRLSRKSTVKVSRLLGRLAFHVSSRGRHIGLANLKCIFGDTMSPKERRSLLIRSMQHNSLTMLDIVWFSRHASERMETYVHWDDSYDFLKPARPGVCLTAHYGNWEVLGQKIITTGYPLMSVANPLINDVVDKKFIEIREANGQDIVSSKGALRKLLHCLRKNGNVALVMDQNTKPRDGGLFIDFFDIPVPISSGPTNIALKTDAIVTFGFCSADDDGHYHIRIPEVLYELEHTDDHEGDVLRLTEEVSRVIEAQIRKDPAPWMWTYKRWTHIQPGTDPTRYPAYALPLTANELSRHEAQEA